MSREKRIEELTCESCLHHFACQVNSEYVPTPCRAYEDKSEYRKQSENVIELPCKIGDLLYMPWEWNGQKGIACLTVTVLRCITGFGWSFGTDFDTDDEDYFEAYNCGSFKLKDFGKTVFLTREEAEAKMKGGAE